MLSHGAQSGVARAPKVSEQPISSEYMTLSPLSGDSESKNVDCENEGVVDRGYTDVYVEAVGLPSGPCTPLRQPITLCLHRGVLSTTMHTPSSSMGPIPICPRSLSSSNASHGAVLPGRERRCGVRRPKELPEWTGAGREGRLMEGVWLCCDIVVQVV